MYNIINNIIYIYIYIIYISEKEENALHRSGGVENSVYGVSTCKSINYVIHIDFVYRSAALQINKASPDAGNETEIYLTDSYWLTTNISIIIALPLTFTN